MAHAKKLASSVSSIRSPPPRSQATTAALEKQRTLSAAIASAAAAAAANVPPPAPAAAPHYALPIHLASTSHVHVRVDLSQLPARVSELVESQRAEGAQWDELQRAMSARVTTQQVLATTFDAVSPAGDGVVNEEVSAGEHIGRLMNTIGRLQRDLNERHTLLAAVSQLVQETTTAAASSPRADATTTPRASTALHPRVRTAQSNEQIAIALRERLLAGATAAAASPSKSERKSKHKKSRSGSGRRQSSKDMSDAKRDVKPKAAESSGAGVSVMVETAPDVYALLRVDANTPPLYQSTFEFCIRHLESNAESLFQPLLKCITLALLDVETDRAPVLTVRLRDYVHAATGSDVKASNPASPTAAVTAVAVSAPVVPTVTTAAAAAPASESALAELDTTHTATAAFDTLPLPIPAASADTASTGSVPVTDGGDDNDASDDPPTVASSNAGADPESDLAIDDLIAQDS